MHNLTQRLLSNTCKGDDLPLPPEGTSPAPDRFSTERTIISFAFEKKSTSYRLLRTTSFRRYSYALIFQSAKRRGVSRILLIDAVLRAGLCEDRESARNLILSGGILVNGHPATRPAAPIGKDVRIVRIKTEKPVSRAGRKLEHALDLWAISVVGRVVVDVGSASGGFTECLLQRGATRVYAMESGVGQLAWKLRQNSRVVVMENTNVLYTASLPEPVSLAVIDISWTPMRQALPVVGDWMPEKGEAIVLLKPNYELQDPGKLTDGVLLEENIRQRVVDDFIAFANRTGWDVTGAAPSPITGDGGNVEWLIRLLRCPLFDGTAFATKNDNHVS